MSRSPAAESNASPDTESGSAIAMIRSAIRSVVGALIGMATRPITLLRVVFLLAGSALALAFALLDAAVIGLLIEVDSTEVGRLVVIVASVGIVAVPPVLIGLLPAVRQMEGAAAETLLGVQFAAGTPGPPRDAGERARGLVWFAIHLLTGGVLVVVVLLALWLVGPLGVLAAAVVAVVLGTLLAWLAPALLGPSYAERLQRLEAEAAAVAERGRMARELHDSIGHALSLVTLQAGAARKVLERDLVFVDEALRAIESTSRTATAELDHVLGLLRDGAPPRTPMPGLESLDSLVTATRSAGLTLQVEVDGIALDGTDRTDRTDGTEIPGVVTREAYRIVQEGLTNALRHSTDRSATLHIARTPDRLRITLANPAGNQRRARGRGLAGITERVSTLGGSIRTGSDGATWRLAVELPLRASGSIGGGA